MAVFAGAGLLLIGLALWLRRRTRALLGRASRAEGRVAGHEWSSGPVGPGAAAMYPGIEFTTADGRTIRFEGRASWPFAPRKGQRVRVLYDPAAPEDAVLESWLELWAPVAIFFSTGVGLLLAAAVAGIALALR